MVLSVNPSKRGGGNCTSSIYLGGGLAYRRSKSSLMQIARGLAPRIFSHRHCSESITERPIIKGLEERVALLCLLGGRLAGPCFLTTRASNNCRNVSDPPGTPNSQIRVFMSAQGKSPAVPLKASEVTFRSQQERQNLIHRNRAPSQS
jgi:hypothetical protein